MMWILGFIGLIVIVQFFRFVKRKEIRLEQDFQKRFSGRKILLMDKYARFIAQQSDGFSQMAEDKTTEGGDRLDLQIGEAGRKKVTVPAPSPASLPVR